MKYMLLMYASESLAPQTQEEIQAAYPAWGALGRELEAAGVLIANNGLSPVANATTVRIREGNIVHPNGASGGNRDDDPGRSCVAGEHLSADRHLLPIAGQFHWGLRIGAARIDLH